MSSPWSLPQRAANLILYVLRCGAEPKMRVAVVAENILTVVRNELRASGMWLG